MNRVVTIGGLLLLAGTTLMACDDLPGTPASAPAQPAAENPTNPANTAEGAVSPDGVTDPAEPGIRLVLPGLTNPGGHVDKRLFGVLPNYRADDEKAEYKPLKTWEKFKIAERDTFDWPNYFLNAGFALQNEIAEKGWHGTGMGKNFAEFYGRSFADAFIGNYVTEAVLPTLLHEDPRFFRSGVGPVWKRAYRAARQVLVTRTENGKERFNFSEVLGNSIVVGVTDRKSVV